jgi:hypothetical protein
VEKDALAQETVVIRVHCESTTLGCLPKSLIFLLPALAILGRAPAALSPSRTPAIAVKQSSPCDVHNRTALFLVPGPVGRLVVVLWHAESIAVSKAVMRETARLVPCLMRSLAIAAGKRRQLTVVRVSRNPVLILKLGRLGRETSNAMPFAIGDAYRLLTLRSMLDGFRTLSDLLRVELIDAEM